MATLRNLLNGTAIMYDGEAGGAGGGAAGDGGAGAAGTGGDGGSAGGAAAAGPFDTIANPEIKGWVASKGFKDVGNLAESAYNLEKLTGSLDSVIKLPKEMTPETMRPIMERLGAGKTPEEYKLPVPDGQSDEFAKTAAGWMHELGIPVQAAQKLAEKWNEHWGGATAQQTQEIAQRDQTQLAQLKADWGQNMQANLQIVDRAAEAFGMSPEQVGALKQAMGPGDAAKFLCNIGSKLGVESDMVLGDGTSGFAGGGSPEAAQARIAELRKDNDFITRYNKGDVNARREMDRLHRVAYPA